MNELELVTRLRPEQPAPDAERMCQAVRTRLTAAYDTPRRRRRPVMLPASTAALAAAAITAVILTGPAATPHTPAQHRLAKIVTAAWTIRANQDRTVTITIGQLRDPTGLQRALQQEGIPAIVRYIPLVTRTVDGQERTGPACEYHGLVAPSGAQSVIVSESEPGGVPEAQATPVSATLPETTPIFVFTIRPRAMPARSAIFIEVSMGGSTPAQAAAMPNAFGLSVLASDHLPRCVPVS